VNGPLIAAGFYGDVLGDKPGALALIDRALAQHDPDPDKLLQAAAILFSLGEKQRAIEVADKAAAAGLRLPGPRTAAAQLFSQFGLPEQAQDHTEKAISLASKRPPGSGQAGTLSAAGMTYLVLGQTDKGLELIGRAVELVSWSAWDLDQMGRDVVGFGTQKKSESALKAGVSILERARNLRPESPSIRYDLAIAYFLIGRTDDQLKEMRAAVEIAPTSAMLAGAYADMLDQAGKTEEARPWHAAARDRAKALLDMP